MLRRLWDAVPCLLAAVFVDTEGECIDYVSALPPFDAKVTGAHMLMMMDVLEASACKVAQGEPMALEINADDRELWVQRVGGEYVLVLVLTPGADRVQLRSAVALAADEFRAEVGIQPPSWEDSGKRLSVRVRASPGWRYAPQGFSEGGVRVLITDVLGRWTESDGVAGDEIVCFRVRTADGQELTLVHDPDADGWMVRGE